MQKSTATSLDGEIKNLLNFHKSVADDNLKDEAVVAQDNFVADRVESSSDNKQENAEGKIDLPVEEEARNAFLKMASYGDDEDFLAALKSAEKIETYMIDKNSVSYLISANVEPGAVGEDAGSDVIDENSISYLAAENVGPAVIDVVNAQEDLSLADVPVIFLESAAFDGH